MKCFFLIGLFKAGFKYFSVIYFRNKIMISANRVTYKDANKAVKRALWAWGSRVCNRLSGYSGYSDIRKNLSVRIVI